MLVCEWINSVLIVGGNVIREKRVLWDKITEYYSNYVIGIDVLGIKILDVVYWEEG